MFKEAFSQVKGIVAKGANMVGVKDDDVIFGITVIILIVGGVIVGYVLSKN